MNVAKRFNEIILVIHGQAVSIEKGLVALEFYIAE